MNFGYIMYISVSVLSIILYVLSVQYKNKDRILITQIFASICYLIVYIFKGAWSGVSIEFLEETKDVCFIGYEQKNRKIPFYILVIFVSLLITCSIIFYDGLLSLLPLLINIILFVATYFRNPRFIRYSLVISGILWGIYNLYVKAYIICIGNVLEVVSAIISLYRFKETDKNFK